MNLVLFKALHENLSDLERNVRFPFIEKNPVIRWYSFPTFFTQQAGRKIWRRAVAVSYSRALVNFFVFIIKKGAVKLCFHWLWRGTCVQSNDGSILLAVVRGLISPPPLSEQGSVTTTATNTTQVYNWGGPSLSSGLFFFHPLLWSFRTVMGYTTTVNVCLIVDRLDMQRAMCLLLSWNLIWLSGVPRVFSALH